MLTWLIHSRSAPQHQQVWRGRSAASRVKEIPEDIQSRFRLDLGRRLRLSEQQPEHIANWTSWRQILLRGSSPHKHEIQKTSQMHATSYC